MTHDDPWPQTVDEGLLEAEFRRRALALHPDRNPDPSAAQALRALLDERAKRRAELARRRPIELQAFRAVIEKVVGANSDGLVSRLARLINADTASPIRILGCEERGLTKP